MAGGNQLDESVRWIERLLADPSAETFSPLKLLLLLLLARDGEQDQATLFDKVPGHRTALVRSVGKMMLDGWVVSDIDPMDRRRRILKLTPAGGELVDRLYG